LTADNSVLLVIDFQGNLAQAMAGRSGDEVGRLLAQTGLFPQHLVDISDRRVPMLIRFRKTKRLHNIHPISINLNQKITTKQFFLKCSSGLTR